MAVPSAPALSSRAKCVSLPRITHVMGVADRRPFSISVTTIFFHIDCFSFFTWEREKDRRRNDDELVDPPMAFRQLLLSVVQKSLSFPSSLSQLQHVRTKSLERSGAVLKATEVGSERLATFPFTDERTKRTAFLSFFPRVPFRSSGSSESRRPLLRFPPPRTHTQRQQRPHLLRIRTRPRRPRRIHVIYHAGQRSSFYTTKSVKLSGGRPKQAASASDLLRLRERERSTWLTVWCRKGAIHYTYVRWAHSRMPQS